MGGGVKEWPATALKAFPPPQRAEAVGSLPSRSASLRFERWKGGFVRHRIQQQAEHPHIRIAPQMISPVFA
jgi:hypothetical protein